MDYMTGVADKLQGVRTQIARAAYEAGRSAPLLLAVSKTQPAEAVRAAHAAGQRDFGENKVQEAKNKWLTIRNEIKDIKLHMIGKLQSNKAKDAIKLFEYMKDNFRRQVF